MPLIINVVSVLDIHTSQNTCLDIIALSKFLYGLERGKRSLRLLNEDGLNFENRLRRENPHTNKTMHFLQFAISSLHDDIIQKSNNLLSRIN